MTVLLLGLIASSTALAATTDTSATLVDTGDTGDTASADLDTSSLVDEDSGRSLTSTFDTAFTEGASAVDLTRDPGGTPWSGGCDGPPQATLALGLGLGLLGLRRRATRRDLR